MASDIPLADQIAEVKRELNMRASAYPRFVAAGKITQAAADKQTARLRAALATLEELAAKDRLL